MKSKKILYLNQLIILVLFVIILASCMNIQEPSQPNQITPITIQFWYGLTGNQGKMMEEYINVYNASQEQVIVVGVSQESYQVTSKAFKSSIVKKSVPDVVLLEDSDMKEMASKNALLDLSQLISQKSDFMEEDFVEIFYEQGVMGERVYAIPIYGTTQILYYRKDLFDQYNINANFLNTWEGLEQASKKLTTRKNNEVIVYGFEPMQGRENLIDASINRGGRFVSEDGKTILLNSEPWVYTFEKFRTWIHEEKIMKVNYGGEGWQYWYATIDDVMQGKAAGYFGSVADFTDLDFGLVSAHVRPAWNNFRDNPTGVFNAHSICIPEGVSDERAKAAFDWINYITSTEISAKWSMDTGYLPVRVSSFNLRVYKDFMLENESFQVANEQLKSSVAILNDPTGGKIYEALKQLSVQIEVFNEPVKESLDEVTAELQDELDRINRGNK